MASKLAQNPHSLRSRRERRPLFAALAVLGVGSVLTLIRWQTSDDLPLTRAELPSYFFFTVFGAGLTWLGLRTWLRPARADYHFEYCMSGLHPGPGRLGALLERLAALGRRVDARVLDDEGEPGPPPAQDTPLVGTQVELRLAADTGPYRVLLRLRREGADEVFGLLEIDDNASMMRRRFAGDVLRELAALVEDLGYQALGSSGEPRAAQGLTAGEMP